MFGPDEVGGAVEGFGQGVASSTVLHPGDEAGTGYLRGKLYQTNLNAGKSMSLEFAYMGVASN